MKKELVVGAVFLLAVGVGLFATIAVSGWDVLSPKATWYVELTDLSGLQTGDDVRVLGHRMGVVRRIRFDQVKYNFRISLRMEANTPIHEGYEIAVRDTSALGGKYLSVSPGRPTEPHADPKTLKGKEVMSDVMGGIADVLTELKEAITAVTEGKGTLGKIIMEDELYQDLKGISASLRVVTERIEKGEGSIGRLISEDDVYVELKALMTKLNRGDSALAKLMKDESGAIVDDLQSASASLKSILAKADRGGGTMAKLLNDPKLYDNLNAGVAAASEVMQDVRGGKGIAGMLVADSDARRNVSNTLENLQAITQSMRTGDGTIARLLGDPQLYDNFNAFAENIKSASAKIDKGDGTIAKLINDPELYLQVKKLMARAIDSIENVRDSAPVSAITSFIMGPFQ